MTRINLGIAVLILCLVVYIVAFTGIVAAASPDLTVTSVNAPSSGQSGGYIAVSWTVKNQGTIQSGSFYNRISLATTPYGTDIGLGNFPMSSIAAGSSLSDAEVPQIPTTVTPGYYYVTVFTDAFQAIAESSETNNINKAPSQIYITSPSITLTLYVHEGSASGPVIAGARVTGSDAAGSSFDQITNSQGYVTLTGKPGIWQFSVSKTGYQTNSWSQSITVTETRHAFLQFANQPPTAFLSANPMSGKAPLTVTFSMSASDPDGSITAWLLDVNGDGNADYSGTGSPPSTKTYTYTSSGSYTAILLVSDNKGATSPPAIETINVGSPNQPPSASLSASPKSGKAPLTVTFSMSASDADGSITTWVLDTGDGNSYSGNGNPPSTKTHTYASSGSYNVMLGVSDNNDATAFAGETISVSPPNQPPICSLSANPKSGKVPLTVTFSMSASDSDGSITAWLLDVNGDGNADYSGTGSPPSTKSYDYTTNGSYNAIFMVSDNNGATCTSIKTINVGSPNKPPTASLSANPISGKAPLTVTFTMSASDSDGTITIWVLDAGDEKSYSGSGNPQSSQIHTYTNAGSYNAVLAVADNDNATGFAVQTITVSPPAQLPGVSTSSASGVGATSATLNGNLDNTGGETCQIWFEYGLTTSYGNSTPKELKSSAGSFSYSVSGLQSDKTYHFRACASNSKGTVCGSDASFVTSQPVNRPPNPPTNLDQFMSDGVTPISTGTVTYEKSVVFRGDLSDPEGDNVQLQIELRLTYDYSGGFLYGRTHWSDFVSSGWQANVPAEGLPNGRYHWQARAVDKYGLASEWVEFGNNPTSAADFLLFVNSLPFASFTYSPAYPDVGQEVTFDASASYDPDGGPISYGWDFGDSSTATGKVAKHTYSETGSYTINLTVTDDEGTKSKYHAEIGVFSAVFGESINRLVSETDKVLDNDILANAKNVGLATDFLAKKVLNEKIGMVTGLIFDLLGYLPVFKVEQVSALSVGQYVRLAEKFPVLTELVDNYGWVAVKISVDQFLMMTEEVTSDIMSKLSSNGYSYSNAFVPDLEAEIINKKGNLTYLKNEVLGSISGLDGERISLYQKDLQKRISANRALGTIYFTKALLPVTLKDIKEDASTGWDIVLGKILYTLLKSVVSIGTSGWSSAVIKVGSIAIELYNKKSQLNSDEEALWYASGTLFDGFAQTELISRNAYQGLKNIRDSVVPSSAEGGIISIENIAVGDFWNKDRVHYNEISFFARKIYSNVTIENTGDIKTEYKLVARYTRPFKFEVIVPIPFGVDLPFIASEEEEIGPHQTKTFSVWYKNDDYGGGSSPGDHDIYFELFGITDNGIYFLDLKPTRYGTTKIVTNGVNVSEEELENASMFSYPIMSEFDNATLYVYTENPFEFPIQANLTQEIPSSLDVISAGNGTINGTNISWQLELKPDEREMINITLKSAGALDTIEIPGAVLEIYDQINDQWFEFASNNVSLNVKNLMGDTDGNCKVDIFDLATVGLCYGKIPSGSCQKADINNDGAVNIFDLAAVGLNYGTTC